MTFIGDAVAGLSGRLGFLPATLLYDKNGRVFKEIRVDKQIKYFSSPFTTVFIRHCPFIFPFQAYVYLGGRPTAWSALRTDRYVMSALERTVF